ncbi:MAG: branched-chain amino acid ABC transporter permease [Pseudorhodoplanes sp.]|nr:branched-chain amino acid ABC transporter permease [Pseudorhodoplanes sp.]
MSKLRSIIAILALLAAGPLAATLIDSPLIFSLLAQSTIAGLFALSVGFLIRQNGMVSFGHAAFFGLPGYAIAVWIPAGAVPGELVIFGAIIFTTLFAFVIGLAIVRVHGIAFGMLTLALGQGLYQAAARLRGVTGGFDGINLRHLPHDLFGLPVKLLQQPRSMLVVTWLIMALILTLVWLFSRSHWGRLTEAIRDNEERVRFLGYNTLIPRALIFAASAMIASIAGVLFIIYNAFISPDTLHWTASGEALIMAILGGTGAPWGPVVGAFIYFFLKHEAGTYTTHWLSIIGCAVILISALFPSGLAGVIARSIHLLRPRANR